MSVGLGSRALSYLLLANIVILWNKWTTREGRRRNCVQNSLSTTRKRPASWIRRRTPVPASERRRRTAPAFSVRRNCAAGGADAAAAAAEAPVATPATRKRRRAASRRPDFNVNFANRFRAIRLVFFDFRRDFERNTFITVLFCYQAEWICFLFNGTKYLRTRSYF